MSNGRLRKVKVNEGYRNVLLPNGSTYDGPETATLSEEQFKKVSKTVFRQGVLTDLGPVDAEEGHTDHTYLDQSVDAAILPPPVLTSPNGSKYRLRVDNLGNLTTTLVAYDPLATGQASGTGFMSESGERLISTSAYCFKGDPMVTEEPFTITALHTDIDVVAGGTYKGIVLIGDTVVEEILGESDLVTAATSGVTHMNFPMNVLVPGGVEVVVLTGRTDVAEGYVLPQDAFDGARSGFTWQDIPATDVGYSCSRIAVPNPKVGTPINRGKGYNSAPFNIKVDWTQA